MISRILFFFLKIYVIIVNGVYPFVCVLRYRDTPSCT